MNTLTGSYLEDNNGKNIGHECINFFTPKSDKSKKGEKKEDEYFLWFNASGKMPKQKEEIYEDITDEKYRENITLLMVSKQKNQKNMYRVLAKAEKCSVINGVTETSDDEDKKKTRYNEFCKQFPNVIYGKSTIQDIFKDNVSKGIPDGINTLATFYTYPNNIYIPKDPSWTIKLDKQAKAGAKDVIRQNMSRVMRMFIKLDNRNDFEKIINSPNWKRLSNDSIYSKSKQYCRTLFTLTGTEKNENVISNVISNCFNESQDLVWEFVKKFINNDIKKDKIKNFTCLREYKNVDLTLLFEDFTIIVENKIDSDISERGFESRKKTNTKIINVFSEYKSNKKSDVNLDFSRETEEIPDKEAKQIYEKIQEEIDNLLPHDGEYSQLTKYVIQSEIDARYKGREGLPIYYFILIPDYNTNRVVNYEEIITLGNDYNYELIVFGNHYVDISFDNADIPVLKITTYYKPLSSQSDIRNYDEKNTDVYSVILNKNLTSKDELTNLKEGDTIKININIPRNNENKELKVRNRKFEGWKYEKNEEGKRWAFSNRYNIITYGELYEVFDSVKDYSSYKPYKPDILNEFQILKSDVDDFIQNREIHKFLEKAKYEK